MKTGFESERVAIYEHLYSNYRLTPISWMNVEDTFNGTEEDAWIRATILNGDTLQKSIGTLKVYRSVGTLAIQIFVKEGLGTRKSLEIADEIDTIFKGLHLTDAQIQFRTPSTVLVGNNTGWYQLNINCPFYRNSVE